MSSDDKRPFVPKKQPKKQEDTSRFMPSRPAEGRIPHRQAKPQQSRRPRQDRRPQSSNRPFRENRNKPVKPQETKRPKQLESETWAYVVEHDLDSGIITALSEKMLTPCRLRVVEGCEPCPPSKRINIGKRVEDREEVQHIVGLASLERMSSFASMQLPHVLLDVLSQHEAYFLESFFNVASNISLKMHAFELLPKIGNKKAMQIVDARGQGFESIEALNEVCNINAIELLSQRFLEELKDQDAQPRLISLLLPVKS